MVDDSIKEKTRRERLRREAARKGIPPLRGIGDEKAYLWWLGGFFDGEGCVCIPERKTCTRYHHDYTLTVEVGGNFKEVLEEMEKRFGGTLSPKGGGSEFAWRLQLSPNKALHFLETIQPYVRLKHREVEIGIEFQGDKVILRSGTSMDAYRAEMERRQALSKALKDLNQVRNVGRRVNGE